MINGITAKLVPRIPVSSPFGLNTTFKFFLCYHIIRVIDLYDATTTQCVEILMGFPDQLHI